MASPPTPPPTSATEMADEARTSIPATIDPRPAQTPVAPVTVVAPTQAKQGQQDSYQLLFPTLANLTLQDDFKQIVAVAERGDLQVCLSLYRSRDIAI